MSRVLNRPMFRLGGSTSGITSGLERPGYYNGKRVAKPEEIREYIETIKSMGGSRGTPPLSDFLMNFGLNLMSASPSGGLLSTAAQAAKDPLARMQERSADERNLNMNLAAKAMSELSDSDETDRRSTWMKKAQEAVSLGMFPDTPEGLKAAYEDARLSSADTSRSSEAERFEIRTNQYIRAEDMRLSEAESNATYDILVEDKLTEKVGQQNGGKLPMGVNARKKKLESATPGTYFYDLANNVVRKFEGMVDGTPTFIEVDQETFEDLSEDPAESNVIKTNPLLEKKKTSQEDYERSISETTENIKDRFSLQGEPQGTNPYDEQVSLTDIVQKTRR
jgi:hypothetical protein